MAWAFSVASSMQPVQCRKVSDTEVHMHLPRLSALLVLTDGQRAGTNVLVVHPESDAALSLPGAEDAPWVDGSVWEF
eukprot:2007426-Rhodomonas_salina.1